MGPNYPGGWNLVSRVLKLRGVPQECIEISISSLCKSSLKQYDTCFKKWWSFCLKKKEDPFKKSISQVLIHLKDLYSTGASYSSLNCHRSSISLLIGPEIGEDERIKRFLKGISKLRPPKPRYESTWNPKVVLDYFSSLPKNEELSFKQLSLKLITLLALITEHRIQTFTIIKRENIELHKKEIEIKIPDQIKTSAAGRAQPVLILPYFKKNQGY
ncbi:hypothetical protein TKK_0014792 [Trichogramma kaykai]